ncbi:DoxX family protein [Cesiribacter sp. SM1]|uniref:DoxX family protein n=1 Tax=Cesiribacter sp. SM1 TaxID=2861196 RepID=UPI001CD32A7E|nr:DoxX family protein [Cesiribacter sp. SM1]
MKQLFSTSYNRSLADIWLLLLRLCVAGFMLTHGIPKLQKLLAGGEIQFGDPIGIGVTASFILIIFAEVVCSVLIALGLATRFASLSLAIAMSVAAFVQHADDPFSRKEPALLYLLIYITLLVFGAGRYSLDAKIGGGKSTGKKKAAKGR